MSQFVFLTILDAASPYDALEHSWACGWHFSTNVLSGSAHSQAEELRLGGEPPASSLQPLSLAVSLRAASLVIVPMEPLAKKISSEPGSPCRRLNFGIGFTLDRGACVTKTVRIGWFRTEVRCETVIHKCTRSACENNNSRRTRQQIERQRPA